MASEVIGPYLRRVERLISQSPGAYVERYTEAEVVPGRVNLRIRLRMSGGHLLSLSETITQEDDSLVFLKYSYHLQDADNQRVFRYDNATHHPNLHTFPDHKHVADTVQPSVKPSIAQVLQEAADAISESSQGSAQ